jgi:hypothetical protein
VEKLMEWAYLGLKILVDFLRTFVFHSVAQVIGPDRRLQASH